MFSYKLFFDFLSNHLYMEHISLNLMWNWSTSRQTVKVVFVRYKESGDKIQHSSHSPVKFMYGQPKEKYNNAAHRKLLRPMIG